MSQTIEMLNNAGMNPLPGVPLVESPFFERFFNEDQTSAELLAIARQLHDVGYAVVDFPDPAFEEMAETLVRDLGGYLSDPSIPRQATHEDDARIQDAWKFHPTVKQIAANPEILKILATLYGRPAWPFQTLNFRYGSQQNPHTDAVHFSSIPERFMCGVWVALEDIDVNAGPLIYYPGSHRWPIYTNEHIGHEITSGIPVTQAIYHPLWQELVRLYQVQPQQFMAKKGQALIWAANLLHGGAPRLNPALTRWSQVTHYYFEGCAYTTPMLSDPIHGRWRYRKPINIISGVLEATPETNLADSTDPVSRELFDADAYLKANPDVAAAGVDAFTHYIEHGFKEGRWLK